MRFRPTWGRFCKAAGVQRGVWCSVPCRAAWSGADQGGELRAAGEGARGWTRLYTPSTSGLHGRSVGGSPLWAGTGVGELFPRRKAWGGVKSWQGKGSTRLNYAGFACPTQGTAASGETSKLSPPASLAGAELEVSGAQNSSREGGNKCSWIGYQQT